MTCKIRLPLKHGGTADGKWMLVLTIQPHLTKTFDSARK